MHKPVIIAALMALWLTSFNSAVAQQGGSTISTTDRLFGLAKVWQEIAQNSVGFARNIHHDWDSLYCSYIPHVIKSASDYEYYRTLQRFAASLDESGTGVTFPRQIADSLVVPPVIIKEIRGRFYITNTDRRYVEKLPIGSEVIRINGFAIRAWLDQEVLPYISASTPHGRAAAALEVMLEGWVNTRVLLNCITPDGRNINEMVDREAPGKVQWVREPGSREPINLSWVNREVALVTINRITPATVAAFPDAKQLARARMVIIDLRGNHYPQPMSEVARLVFRLTDRPYVVFPGYATRGYPFDFRSGDPSAFGKYTPGSDFMHFPGDTLFRPAGTPPPLSVPLAILTGASTGFSAEHFLMFMKQSPQNIPVIGERTAGATGYSLPTELPGGGRVWVNVRYDNYVDDDWFREGYIPDLWVPLDLKSLLNGEDLPLLNAIRILQQR